MGKKTIITICILSIILCLSIWVFSTTYSSAREQYSQNHEKSKELALEVGKLSSVDSIDTFYGQLKYHVLSGKNNKDEKVYAWVPQKEKSEEVIVENQSSGITKEEAIKKVSKEYDLVELIVVNLGMDEGIPIWEVKYRDKSNRYTFDYVRFSDGTIVKHMAIKNIKGM